MSKHLGLSLLLAAAVPAQVFVVDAAGGAGAHFTSIATAANTVPDGAVLDVRPGTYAGFTITGKSLSVICDNGVRVVDLGTPPIWILSIPAGKTVLLHNLQFAHISVVGSIACRSSPGTIVIDRCVGDQTVSIVGGRITARDCASVHIRDSTIRSTGWFDSAMELLRSHVTVTSSSFSTSHAVPIAATDSILELTDSDVAAGLVAPTVALHQSRFVVRAGCTLTASLQSGAIIAGSGTADLDPGTVLQNAPAQPFGGVTVTTVAGPALTGTPGIPGGTATGTLTGPGVFGWLVIGAPWAASLPLGGTQFSWIRPGTETVLIGGPLPLFSGYAVPNAPWVTGVTLTWQGASFSPVLGVQLSNPVVLGHY